MTVFAESAGAQTLAILLAAEPKDDASFHRAILQSFPGAVLYQTAQHEAETTTNDLIQLLGCSGISCLK